MTASTAPLSEPQFHTAEATLFAEQFRALQELTGRIVPFRKAFNPNASRTLLPFMAILEMRDPGVILVRLVGTAIINRAQVNMTGKNLLDFYPEAARQMAWAHHSRMLETPCGSTFLSREEFGNLVTHAEIVNFPLADETGTARFIIGIAIELRGRDLRLQGDNAMQIGALTEQRYLDIGAGT